MGIPHRFVRIADESRLCLNIVDETNKTETEILEAGPVIGAEEWGELQERVSELAAVSDYVVLSGSLPRGLAADAYAVLVDLIRHRGAKAVVDSSGAALEHAVRATPFMIKPNRDELMSLLHTETLREQDMIAAMRQWNEQGIAVVVVSLGSSGALVADRGTVYKVTPPAIAAVNTVGCGDAFVAGLTAGWQKGLEMPEALVLATATAAANALKQEAGNIAIERLADLKKNTVVRRL